MTLMNANFSPRNEDATHVLPLDPMPPDEFKLGRHGLLFGRHLGEWVRTTVQLKELDTIDQYRNRRR